MSGLDELLELYAPPPAPQKLAGRAVAAAVAQPQQKARRFGGWRRTSGRGGWKRSVWLGSAVLGLAFTSAVAAEVVSGGQIEIPVVHQVVEAIPASLKLAPHKPAEKKQIVARESRRVPAIPVAAAAPQAPEALIDGPAPMRQRLMQRFAGIQQRVQERRAAGLPTPRADRLERRANRIVARRQAKGLPTPPVEQVEMRLAMRQARIARMVKRMPDDPAAITDLQVQQFTRILPPPRRERFVALDPAMQRQMMVRFAQRLRAKRAERLEQAAPDAPQQP
jgi:hypothetical protein